MDHGLADMLTEHVNCGTYEPFVSPRGWRGGKTRDSALGKAQSFLCQTDDHGFSGIRGVS